MASTPDGGPTDGARTEIDLPDTQLDARSVRGRTAVPTALNERYELGPLLGEGGMGEVLESRDRVIERSVALKIIRRDRHSRHLETRFVREACVQAQLEHPCVVPVYDVARDADGYPFFTMRKVDGITLDQVIEKLRSGDATTVEAFTRHRMLTAFAQVCLTVDYAHARGVLHRDLKPGNVMFGDFGEVYILDWGLAKLTLAESAVASSRSGGAPGVDQRTVAGSALGTPAYMPPEQFRDGSVDERADVFALGAVLFEILTLEPLFDDEAIAKRVRREPLTWDARPSARATLDHIPELERVCVRATAEAAEKRYPSARALHDVVQAYLGGERDLELRNALATSWFARAEDARETDRDLALREVQRALALAPDDPRGLALIVELLKTTPAASAKAREEVVSEGLARLRRAEPLGALLLTLPWLTVYPALWVIRGVTSVWQALVAPLAWVLAAIALLIDNWQASQERVRYPTYALAAAVALTSLLLGPILVVPQLAVMLIANLVLVSARRLRWLSIALLCGAVVIPTFLALVKVHDVYRFTSETAFTVHGVFRAVNVLSARFLVTFIDLVILVSACFFAGRFRDEIERARTQSALFTWHLSNLLPGPSRLTAGEDGGADAVTPVRRPVASLTGLLDTEIDATPIGRTRADGSTSIISTPGDDEAHDEDGALIGTRYEHLAENTFAERDSARATAYRDRKIGREVAMKREGDALLQARLDHPGVPPVYDAGEDEAGPWFTTKLVRGASLADMIDVDRGVENARHRRLAAFSQVCLTLDFAHARGIVHGALEPKRVVLGEFGEVYVLGWGQRAMAHAYAAPEQVAAGRVDARADVFALGAILYELVCDKPLFAEDDAFRRVLGKYDARPSARADSSDTVAPELDEVCAKACAYDPADRHASARDLHDAVEAYASRDRDEVLRRVLAAERLERATRSAEHALGSNSEASRIEALRELGRALALLSDRSPALRLLERLLASPPSPLPEVVTREITAQASSVSRRSIPGAAKAYVTACLLVFPLVAFLAGVRDAFGAAAISIAWAIAAAAAFAEHAFANRAWRLPSATVSGLLAAATTSLLFGPSVLGPTAVIAMTMGYVLGGRLKWRRTMIVLGCVAIVAPAVLTWIGVLDAFVITRTEGGAMAVTLRGAIYHPRDFFLGGLMIASGVTVLVAGAYAARFRDALEEMDAENRAKVLALSRLLS